MFTPGINFEYNWREKKELTTNIKVGREQFISDFCNELGQQGEFAILIGEENEPSSITAATPQGNVRIQYYILKVLTAKAVAPEKE